MPPTLEQANAIMKAVTIDIWNEGSKSKRIELMRGHCSPDFKAYAPNGSETIGYEECDANYDKLHADGRQDWKFEKSGDLWMNGNVLMQRWIFGKDEEGWKGWDVIILGDDGKVASLYGLVEGLHNHSG